MKGQVPVQAAKERNAILRKILNETGYEYRGEFFGRSKCVLWESSHRNEDEIWVNSGLTDNYIRVYNTAHEDLWNQFTRVQIKEHHPSRNGVIGIMERTRTREDKSCD